MSNRSFYSLAALVSVCSLLVAGCGGSDTSSTTSTTAAGVTGATRAGGAPLSEQEFVTQGNAICKAGNQEIGAAFKSLGLQKGQQPSQQQLAQLVTDKVAPSIQGQIDDIRALSPPANLQSDVTKFLDDAQTALDKVKADPTLITQGNAFADVNKEGTAIGLDQCAG